MDANENQVKADKPPKKDAPRTAAEAVAKYLQVCEALDERRRMALVELEATPGALGLMLSVARHWPESKLGPVSDQLVHGRR